MTRSARELESRDNEIRVNREVELRDNDMLYNYSMDYLTPITIPHGVKKEGYDYYWAATNIKGEAVWDVERLLAKGWELVPADRAPNFSRDPLGRNPYHGQYIATKDLILMERPCVYLQRERTAFNHMNNNKIRSLRGVRDSYGNVSNSSSFMGYSNSNYYNGFGANRIDSF